MRGKISNTISSLDESIDEYRHDKGTKLIDIAIDIAAKALLLLILLFAILPVYWMVVSSFRRQANIIAEPEVLPSEVYHQNYLNMWERLPLVEFYLNSLVLSTVTTILSLTIGTLAAYSLSRYDFPGKKKMGGLIIGTQMIPGILILLPIFLIFLSIQENIGIPMQNTYHGMILLFTTFTLPFSIWMMWGYMDAIPEELEAAARIDGCSRLEVLRYVVFPLAVPGMAATGIFVFLIGFNEVLFSSIFATRDVTPFSIGIRYFEGQTQTQWGEMMAAASLAAIPILVIFYAFQKQIIAGLTEGGMKH